MFRYRATMTVKISTRYEFFFFFSTPCEDSIKILKSGHVICFRPFLVGGVYFYTQRYYIDRIFLSYMTSYSLVKREIRILEDWADIFRMWFSNDISDGHVFLGLCVSLVYSMHGVNVFFAYGLLDRVSMLLYDDHYRGIFNFYPTNVSFII